MAYPGSKQAQQPSFNPLYTPIQMHDEANVYDLDDPYLIPKILGQQQYPRVTARSITCRFSAIPLNEPYVFFHNIAQYGYIIHESQDKLIIRLPKCRVDLLDRIRRVWVSKYLAPLTECRITFDLPKRGSEWTTLVIMQRVLPKINMSGADDALVGDGTTDPNAVADGGQAALLPEFSGDPVPLPARRVCNY
ncbi:hypothetical protein F4801DRAFT_243161 [Xylaria longipes]|nr:hypothetical protein F4801DRAFT_243161 [Xylaria longipes]